jgi:hypothetical protein
MNAKKLAIAAFAIAAALAAASAEARGRDDVQWSVTIGAPLQPFGAATLFARSNDGWRDNYRAVPSRWDRDGDGIPNRYDRRYNPPWDRDGDGVPNRYDRHDDSRRGGDRHGGGRW